jgi:hypothetical protein
MATAARRMLPAVLAFAACAPSPGPEPAAGTGPAAAAPMTATTTPTAADDAGPILLELFTSQGCSSCPPADRVLSRIAADGAVGDRAVVALAFHVDYWNDLGWADPMSRAAWTDRQRAYAGAFGDGRVYTPQLVVGGRGHVVGSNVTAIAAQVAAAPAPAALDATITWSAGGATVTAAPPPGARAWVAFYEDALTTTVARGENAGEQLRNDHVVRVLVPVAGATGEVAVPLDPAWRQVGAVAFAQDADLHVVATRALGPRPAP